MPKRSSKPRDLNSMAAAIVNQSIDPEDKGDAQKDTAAVESGRKGGLKGGKARAENLTAEQRSGIAKKAVAARWSKKSD